jgi:adenylate cyclase
MQPQGGSAKLVVSEEGKPELTIELADCLTIGRSPRNDLVLDDQMASRRHAEIRSRGGGMYTLLDAGSANGTWLNGRRLTSPRELADGDVVLIGNVKLRFSAPAIDRGAEPGDDTSTEAGTGLSLRHETVVVLVTDIRNYTRMSEALPRLEFSLLIADWFRQGSEIVERCGGTIDKFIGDAVMAYWLVRAPADPAREINDALLAARDLIGRAEEFAQRVSAQFPGHAFRIGIGINMGEALVGNVGGGGHPSFTVVGDDVNIAFGLESLTKVKGYCVIVSRKVTEHASKDFEFADLGRAEVKGRTEPLSIWALNV